MCSRMGRKDGIGGHASYEISGPHFPSAAWFYTSACSEIYIYPCTAVWTRGMFDECSSSVNRARITGRMVMEVPVWPRVLVC